MSEEDLLMRLDRIESKLDLMKKAIQRLFSVRKMIEHLKDEEVSIEGLNFHVIYAHAPKLSKSLIETLLAVDKLEEASASDVARETGRSRSVESIYLNQLERMGYLEKFRKGRKIYFKIPSITLKDHIQQ